MSVFQVEVTANSKSADIFTSSGCKKRHIVIYSDNKHVLVRSTINSLTVLGCHNSQKIANDNRTLIRLIKGQSGILA